MLVPAGFEGIRVQPALVVVTLPPGELDSTRRELSSALPVLFVRAGLRPGGLAPDQTLTRFSWSLSERD